MVWCMCFFLGGGGREGVRWWCVVCGVIGWRRGNIVGWIVGAGVVLLEQEGEVCRQAGQPCCTATRFTVTNMHGCSHIHGSASLSTHTVSPLPPPKLLQLRLGG